MQVLDLIIHSISMELEDITVSVKNVNVSGLLPALIDRDYISIIGTKLDIYKSSQIIP